jgi:hypothetical protein
MDEYKFIISLREISCWGVPSHYQLQISQFGTLDLSKQDLILTEYYLSHKQIEEYGQAGIFYSKERSSLYGYCMGELGNISIDKILDAMNNSDN